MAESVKKLLKMVEKRKRVTIATESTEVTER
jgi:hypothetical protein